MKKSSVFRVVVGSFIVISLLLTNYVNPNWMWFTVFIGVNLIQSGFSKWCLLDTILDKFGLKN